MAQFRIISKLKQGVSPSILKKTVPKDDLDFYRWICYGIDILSKFVGGKYE